MLLHAVQCLRWEQLEVSSMRKSTGDNSFVTTALFAGLCCPIHFHYLMCCSCAYTWCCIFIASINSVTLLSTSLLGYFEIVPKTEKLEQAIFFNSTILLQQPSWIQCNVWTAGRHCACVHKVKEIKGPRVLLFYLAISWYWIKLIFVQLSSKQEGRYSGIFNMSYICLYVVNF